MEPLSLVGQAAFKAATSFAGSKLQQQKIYSCYVAASERAIESLSGTYPAGTPEWNQLVDLLRDAERAMSVAYAFEARAFSSDAVPEIPSALKPFVEQFCRDLAMGLISLVSADDRPGFSSVLIALGSIRAEIERLARSTASDPADEAWFLDPQAPQFIVHHASTQTEIQFEIEQNGHPLPIYFWRYRGPVVSTSWRRNNQLSPYQKTAAHVAKGSHSGDAVVPDDLVGSEELGMEFAFWHKGAWRHIIRRFPSPHAAPVGRDRTFTGSGDPYWDPT